MSNDYDIAMMSDLRLPGGTTASMAEEIRAQAAAGYRTALVHVNSPLVQKNLGVSPHLRRCIAEKHADLVIGEPVRARLALLRHPTVFARLSRGDVDVVADQVLLVANNPAADAHGEPYYDPERVVETISGLFGSAPSWHPIGPSVRHSLESSRHVIDVADKDWVNVMDVDEWHVDRSGVEGIPTIGRHSRPQSAKWPEIAEDILAAYPDHADVRVRVLGGAKPVENVLGRIPDRWIVEQFGARDPQDFLANVDFFVYFHNHRWVEAYGRTIMEAMASGAVVILPEHFRESFEDAAIYATPAHVVNIVRRLAADRESYLAQSRRGRDLVVARHGYDVHTKRLNALIGPPAGKSQAVLSRRRRRDRTRVMFVSSNGAGMGHLSRLLAMARRAGDGIEPFFFSLSQAVSVVERFGFPWEYCPSRGDLDVETRAWNDYFATRITDVIRTYDPRALVFDGTWPYQGLLSARQQVPDLAYVWSRRAMWREGTNSSKLDESAKLFDLVIEPGEIAGALDRGPTVGRGDAHVVDPVTVLDRTDLLSREKARAELGIGPDEPAMLMSLGAGNINDIRSDLDMFVSDLGRRGGWQIHATKPPIARDGAGRTDVRPLSVYPLAKYLHAFDAAVAAAGYNSYHELVMAGVPTVYVPNLQTTTDDQLARAHYAEKVGIGLCVEQVTAQTVAEALDMLTDEATRVAMRSRAAQTYSNNGAAEAMNLVTQLL